MTVQPPDQQSAAAAQRRQDVLTKPTGALGRLEAVAAWACAVQGRCPAEPFADVRVVLLAGDHGVAAAGVSAYPGEVTAQMVANFVAGGAAVSVLARQVGATVQVVDVAVASDTPVTDPTTKVRRGSGRFDREDALSEAEAERAVAVGRALADRAVDDGADLLVPGDMGIGNTTTAAVAVAVLTGAEPVAVVGRGTGIDDEGWMRKTAVVRDALRRATAAGAADDPYALLRTVGGADLGAMAGLLAQAAVRRTPVLLDGVFSGAAALLAERFEPGAAAWWHASHRSTEPCHRIALEALGLRPVLDLDLRLGEGTGALLALPLVQAAVLTLRDMATFGEAGVSDRDAPSE